MNGIELNNSYDQFITPRQEHERLKLRERCKLFFCLFASNVFVYLLTYNTLTLEEKNSVPVEVQKSVRKDHLRLDVPLKIFLKINQESDDLITLTNRKGEIIVKKAYLIKSRKKRQQKTSWELQGPLEKFQIEVHKRDVEKIRLNQSDYFLAYPYHQETNTTTNQSTQVSIHEIIF